MSGDIYTNLSLFQGLDEDQLSMLRSIFVPCDYYAGTMIFAQGDPAEQLYIVVSGEVIVNFKPDDGPPLTVARIRPSSVVGWSAALGSRTYTSAAVCTEYTQLLRVRGSDLRQLFEAYPEIGPIILDRLAALIAERLRNTHPQVVAMLEQGLLSGARSAEVNNSGGC
jgi:CRP-like cAMP-binding protein